MQLYIDLSTNEFGLLNAVTYRPNNGHKATPQKPDDEDLLEHERKMAKKRLIEQKEELEEELNPGSEKDKKKKGEKGPDSLVDGDTKTEDDTDGISDPDDEDPDEGDLDEGDDISEPDEDEDGDEDFQD
jgi:hypothetical protein